MRIHTVFPLLALLLALSSCKEKNKSIYESCCGASSTIDSVLVATPDYDSNGNVIDSVVEAHIFIPNVFVPDEDVTNVQLNEAFQINFGQGVYQIKSVVYSTENGDILFQRTNYYPDQDDLSTGWNGVKPDGTIHYGKFHYQVTVSFLDGQIKTYEGDACAVKCGEDGFPADNIPNCLFRSQNNGNGVPDPHLPGSAECF